MSRSQSRARKRRARAAEVVAEFNRLRSDPEELWGFLQRLAGSSVAVWSVASAAAAERPLDETERAMIAQAVAPHLAGMAPGSVDRRRAMGEQVS